MKKLIFIILLLSIPVSSLAGELSTDPQKLFDFATELYNSGDYYGAVLEYQRLLSFYPNSSLTGEALFMSGMGYLKAGREDDAAGIFDSYVSQYHENSKAQDALFCIAESYFTSNRYHTGIYKLHEYKKMYNSEAIKDSCDYLIGWGYLSQHLFKQGESAFYHLGLRQSEYKVKAQGLTVDLEKGNHLSGKSPLVAGVLSAIIPGSGQMYAGRFYDGMVSFVLNASFLYLSAEGFRTGNNSTGLFFGVIELGWYSSNIYGAVNAANKYNKEIKAEFVKGLKKKYEFPF